MTPVYIYSKKILSQASHQSTLKHHQNNTVLSHQNSKRYPPIFNIKICNNQTPKQQKSNSHTTPTHKTQLILSGQQLRPSQDQSDHNIKTPTTYHKRWYSLITNFLEGPNKTTQDSLTFLKKPVLLSTTCAPYINRQNKKYKINPSNSQTI